MVSNPLDDAFAEQALRPEQKEDQRDHIRQPAFDAAAEQRTPIELAEFFADTDDDAADDSARDRGETAKNENRQRLEGDDLERERNVGTRAPHDPRYERNKACGKPDNHPDLLERDANRQCGAMAVSDRTKRAADTGLLKKDRQGRNHHRGNDSRGNIYALKGDKPAQHLHIAGAARPGNGLRSIY